MVRRGVDAAERPVEREGRDVRRSLRPLRDHYLERVAIADVALRAANASLVVVLRGVAGRFAVRRGRPLRLASLLREKRGDGVRVPVKHLGDARRVVEAHKGVGDDEAAHRKAGAPVRERHGRLQLCDVVVGEVADHRAPGGERALRGGEVHDPRPPPHEAVASEAALLDRFEQEGRATFGGQPEVGPERGDQVGVDVASDRHGNQKDLPREGLRAERGCRPFFSRRRSRSARGARPTRCGRESSPQRVGHGSGDRQLLWH